MSHASSPCIGLCTLDEAGSLCLGCGRTVDEIARWGGLPESERRGIMAILPGRLAAPAGRRPSPRAPAMALVRSSRAAPDARHAAEDGAPGLDAGLAAS